MLICRHQWDGQEDHAHHAPYKACLHNCMCQGAYIHGRMSSMIVYKGLSERSDRRAVRPQPEPTTQTHRAHSGS